MIKFVGIGKMYFKETIQDLFSLTAWKYNRWFHHLGASFGIVAIWSLFNWNMVWLEHWLLWSVLGFMIARGWEFYQQYVILKNREPKILTEAEEIASWKDINFTTICFVIFAFAFAFLNK